MNTKLVILRTQKNKLGECKVYIEYNAKVKGKRRRKRTPSDIWVKPASWSKSKERVLTSDSQYEPKNDKLRKFYNLNKVNDPFNQKLQLKKNTPKTIVEYLDSYIEFRKARGEKRTSYKEFTTVKNRMVEYQKDTGEILYFETIDIKFADDLLTWLSGKKYDPNTIKKHFSTLKTFLNHYYKRQDSYNIALKSDFLAREFGYVVTHYSPPMPLTNTEFISLYFDQYTEWKRLLTEEEIKVKDMMLLQCSTGLRYSDLFRITPDKIKSNILYIEPQKTERSKKDNLCKIPLNQYSSHVLKRYDWNTKNIKMTNQHYNKQIKEIAKVMKFDTLIEKKEYNGLGDIEEKTYPKHKLLSSHNMRDTFITLSIKAKIDIPTIMKYVGQSSWEVMQKYVKLDDNHLISQMENFNDITSDKKLKPSFVEDPKKIKVFEKEIAVNAFKKLESDED